MSAVRIVAIVLVAAGILGLVYGTFSYTKETHDVKLGPLKLSVKERQTVNVPIWAGVGAIVAGVGLRFWRARKTHTKKGHPMRVWPGHPSPLGATWDGNGVNFALFSEHATKVELCLFDSADADNRDASHSPAGTHRPGLARLPARSLARTALRLSRPRPL